MIFTMIQYRTHAGPCCPNYEFHHDIVSPYEQVSKQEDIELIDRLRWENRKLKDTIAK